MQASTAKHKIVMLIGRMIENSAKEMWTPIWHFTDSDTPMTLRSWERSYLEDSLQDVINETLKLKELVRTAADDA